MFKFNGNVFIYYHQIWSEKNIIYAGDIIAITSNDNTPKLSRFSSTTMYNTYPSGFG